MVCWLALHMQCQTPLPDEAPITAISFEAFSRLLRALFFSCYPRRTPIGYPAKKSPHPVAQASKGSAKGLLTRWLAQAKFPWLESVI